jgi:hypothetical protein
MTKIKIYFILSLFATLGSSVFAQTYKLENVENFRGNGIKPVKNENGIAGFTIFYKTDKADSKNDNYAFELLDEKLNKVSRVKVVLPRGSRLIQSVHNGVTLGMMFYNAKESEYLFRAYDNTLKLVGSSKQDDINKYERAAIAQMTEEESSAIYGIHAVPGKGFVRAGYGEDKDQFSVTAYDVNFKKKWSYQTPKGTDGMETFFLSDISDKYVSGLIMRRKGMMSTKFEYFLAVFDIETGKKLVDVSVEKGKENLSISATSLLDNDQVLVQGEYYDADDKAGVNKSNGLYLKKFDIKTGKAIGDNKLSWKGDIKKMFGEKGDKRIEDNYSNYPMSLIRAANGHTYIVYEQFKKAADGVGIAVIALGGRASAVKVKIGDLWMLELDENDKPVGVKYYEKEGSSLMMPPGLGMYGTGLLGMFAKAMGGFDYQFTQKSANSRTFSVAYVNYDREEGEKSKPIVASIFMTDDGSLNYDKVDITAPKKTNQYLYPAPGNNIMLVQYNYKEEVLSLKLIKMNY